MGNYKWLAIFFR